jgi:hypothetical protein
MIGNRRNRLLNRLTVCGGFVLGAAVLWLFAVLSSWWGKCPHGLELGQDKGMSAWPPAGQCMDRVHGLYYYEAQPWVKPVILALLGCAFLILAVSVVAAVRDRRADATTERSFFGTKRAAP